MLIFVAPVRLCSSKGCLGIPRKNYALCESCILAAFVKARATK